MEKCTWCHKYIRPEQSEQYEGGEVYHLDCWVERNRIQEETGRLCDCEEDCICERGED